jgi:hypothetical protein
MGKIVVGVVVGYLTMVVFVFVLFGLGWMVFGAGGSFKPNSWDPSFVWVLVTIAVGFLAAIAGGYVCLALANDTRAIFWLLAVVLVLGFSMATMALFEGAPPVGFRPSDMSMMEAMQNARQPAWLAFLNPILGVIGVLLGARMRGGDRF